jgi:GT2 family glycosyltransferase
MVSNMKNNKISILLPCYKAEKLLENVFIPSLRHFVCDWELILRDNGGNGNLKKFASNKIKIIGKGENVGLNVGLNDCSKYATGKYFYLCHCDMSLLPGWDTALLQACKNLPPASFLLCSRGIEPTKGHTEFHIIKNYGMEWNEFEEKKLLEDFKNYKDNTIVTGKRMPFFMHRKLWERMNGVDENYFSYCTDDDLIQEAYDKGCRRFWMVYDSLIYHLQGKSNNQQTIDKDKNEPYYYFIDKWKKRGYIEACHPGQWHPKLIPDYVKIK